MRKYLLFTGLALFLFSNTAFSALIKKGDNIELKSDCTVNSDLYMFGQQIEVSGNVDGDLAAFGQYVDVYGDVSGNLYSAAQRIRVTGRVRNDFIGFAQDIEIEGKIGGGFRGACNTFTVEDTIWGDVLIGAARVEIGRNALITGNLYAGAEKLIIRGEILGNVIGGAETFRHSGRIGKAVKLQVEEVDFSPDAVIGGNFYYKGERPLDQDLSGNVSGEVIYSKWIDEEEDTWWMCGIWLMVSSLITAVLIAGLFKNRLLEGFEMFTRHGWKSLLTGFLSFLVMPVTGVIMLVTVFGIPVGIFILAMYGFLLYIGWCVAAIILGKLGLGLAGVKKVPLFAAGILGIVVLIFIGMIPVLGCFLNFLAMLLGFGVTMQLLHKTFWGKSDF
ncbi:MAG: hypothetical protein H8E46_01190 [FCB group bacterium]|nr:hypothetical protein [FCB group bacterium]